MDKKKLKEFVSGLVTDLAEIDVQNDGEGGVVVVLSVDPVKGAGLEDMRQKVEAGISELGAFEQVSVILTAHKGAKRVQRPVADPHGMSKNPVIDVPARQIIAVASGKGGVGKSTVSVNIAAGLAAQGFRVGLLDADIYGPSQPMMVGEIAYKPSLNEDKKLVPLERFGMKIMSIGFIADTDKALVWRGPMVQTAFYQMLRDVDWGSAEEPLDYLIIDLPPGTGDVQLTLAQKVKCTGAVIVSTPQDIALIDARRAVEMFEKTGVPVLGLVENMSVHVCSECGHADAVFGENCAEKLDLPILGKLPLSRGVREMSDAGTPVVLREGTSAESFRRIVDNILCHF